MRDARMTIGEVTRRVGLTTQGIRYYERKGLLLRTSRAHTGYRMYGPEVLSRLSFIKRARQLRLSLSEVKEILRQIADRKPALELLADRLMNYYDPVVFIVAALAFAGWLLVTGDPLRATLVLLTTIIMCPASVGMEEAFSR